MNTSCHFQQFKLHYIDSSEIPKFFRKRNTVISLSEINRNFTVLIRIENIIECPTIKNMFLFEKSFQSKQKCKFYVVNSITALTIQILKINHL